MSLSELIDYKLRAMQDRLFTSLPGKVLKVKSDEECTTVDVQVMINHVTEDGYAEREPELEDVPVFYPSGGGAALLLPLEEGDLVEVRFGNRNIGDFLNTDGSKPITPNIKRNHNVNNAWVVPGGATYKKGFKQEDNKAVFRYKDIDISISNTGEINLGGSGVERLILGDSFISAFLNHTHTHTDTGNPAGTALTTPVTTVLGVLDSSVPATVAVWEQNLSNVSKTE